MSTPESQPGPRTTSRTAVTRAGSHTALGRSPQHPSGVESPSSMIEVHCPKNGRVVGAVPDLDAAQVQDLAEDMRRAQTAWEALGPAGRRRWLFAYADWLGRHEAELSELLRAETGKAPAEAGLELPVVLDIINYVARNAVGFLADDHPRPHGLLTAAKRLTVTYRPQPLVGVISPWNLPLMISLGDGVPALAAGAAVLVKPSEFTPLTVARAIEGWAEIGAPAVLKCATGGGEAGAAVVSQVDYVQFTGSTRTGIAVAESAARRLVPCSLELGGKDAAIVLADADLDRAANALVWGAMFNSGQACTSVERAYVEAPIYDKLVAMVVEKAEALRAPEEIGPLANEAQVRIVERHLNDAVKRGARVLTGGQRDGNLVKPAVVVDVDHSMELMRIETFGPTLPIMKVAGAQEAIDLTNDSNYGLSASIWSSDLKRARELARQITAGAVNINDMFANVFALPTPQAGWKKSGLGARFGGPHTVRKYCQTQTLVEPRLALATEPFWYPYSASRTRLVSTVMKFARVVDRCRRVLHS